MRSRARLRPAPPDWVAATARARAAYQRLTRFEETGDYQEGHNFRDDLEALAPILDAMSQSVGQR